MGGFDAERGFARCYAYWAAGTNFRQFRTAQQDEAAARSRRIVTRLRHLVRGVA